MSNPFKINFESLKSLKKRSEVLPKTDYNFDEILEAVKIVGQNLMTKNEKFSLEDGRMENYKQLIFYFFNDPRFNGDLGKGLFIRGGCGSGKTMMMTVFRTLCFHGLIPFKKAFLASNCEEIVNRYEMHGPETFQKYFQGNWFFDDLGQENKHAMYYGTSRNVMKDVLKQRYRNFVEKGHLTFLTSNYDFKIVGEAYDDRIQDRCYEMFNDIILDGKSLR